MDNMTTNLALTAPSKAALSHLRVDGRRGSPISPLVGEMPGRAEGGVAAYSLATSSAAPSLPPSVTFGDISPTRREIRGSLLRRLLPTCAIALSSGGNLPTRGAR
ncbi:Hypothetical protein NGAL_HAMBI2566_22250 [Neorhizobium galegae bv. orientalis]|nr:Hypothetical protein NGAL_HAMBI2566_22250 [Neorhizobium galegae bv. orientalis]CDZ69502.1 Hypothetical protein NGAL_HAMBI2610_11010 [Neorhizobium galegae bv. orientalis]